MMRSKLLQAMVCGAMVAAIPAGAQIGKTTHLDPNLATEAQLTALPGMTPALVKVVLEKRPFLTMTAFDAALGSALTADQKKTLYGRAFVHINLNTATKDEINLIPGMGPRMLHEFEEYRPYKTLAQFHREIGKYVKEDELARLESHVFVPLDINTASDADLLTIPGLGNRMLHEFKEYRPYRDAAQFRREIGKYVNAKEVSRLERYVVLP
jgi:DNA uptake protein ComE-like DNA-binding protein